MMVKVELNDVLDEVWIVSEFLIFSDLRSPISIRWLLFLRRFLKFLE